MREISISLTQRILNKANSRVNFTKELIPSSGVKGRYVVTSTEIFKGKNPSATTGLILKIAEAVEMACPFVTNGHFFNSIGGWTDPGTNIYYIGANLHYSSLSNAVKAAKDAEQTAIYDQLTDEVIYLKDLGYDYTNEMD